MDAPTDGVYLIHFERPYCHAQHYLGWSKDVPKRLAAHAAGRSNGGRLIEVAQAAGIPMVVAMVEWGANRTRERQLKNWKGHAQFCPVCKGLHAGMTFELEVICDE